MPDTAGPAKVDQTLQAAAKLLGSDQGVSEQTTGHGAGDAGNIGRLTAGVAHEFNSLFQALLGNLELLAEEHAHAPKPVTYVRTALELVHKGARLTHSLLSFSTSQLLRPQPVAVDDIMSKLRIALEPIIPASVNFRVSAATTLPMLLVDTSQLLLALHNVCANACEAMAEGGTLTLEVSQADDTAGSRSLMFRISDTGEGMTPELLALAKQPFFTTRGKAMRSGLGLSMADGFARQSGGSLMLESIIGKGTSVTLLLPAAPDAQSVAQPAAARRQPHILLVEDSPHLLEVYIEMLSDAGFTVIAAPDAAAAMRRIESDSQIDLLVTDFILPGANGLELAQLARVVRPDLMTLLITGFVNPTQLASLPEDVRILGKPFRSDQLLRSVRALLTTRLT